ncbi:MAG: DUF2961 domain-containing protein [Candidatus Aminicenantes bacterium]|nr:DUF2961 domain-containing protein [Candidatus Aminicenantes bacterium]
MLKELGKKQNYSSKRVSSYDKTDGNADRITIEPGETAVLAVIEGPAAIHHIWMTISAEPFYGRKIILRMYWDGEIHPSVEVPVGDFFGVGHGLNRNLSSLPIACSSEGRARNCYWYMPFARSARITATNEGTRKIGAFYYYIDYRNLARISFDTPYFHAVYRQETPCRPDMNYLILDAKGQGHYVGCVLSILQRSMGWWGEGDDMIFIDGETFPSLHGTGSEDYFSDAWGMREDENLFYGCPLQETDFKTGAKASVYRFHIPDPIPFKQSIRVTIEHGHNNDRSDFYSSIAYWYQIEPHTPFTTLPPVEDRLPFALESSRDFLFPQWEKIDKGGPVYTDPKSGIMFSGKNLAPSPTSSYNQEGLRYHALTTEGALPGYTANLTLTADTGEHYDISYFFIQGPEMGNVAPTSVRSGEIISPLHPETFEGFSPERKIQRFAIQDVLLAKGNNTLTFEVTGKSESARGSEMSFVGVSLKPSFPRFLNMWNVLGPFHAPDMSSLQIKFPPEENIDLLRSYEGKNNQKIIWRKITAEESGYVRLDDHVSPSENAIAYGLVYVFSPKEWDTEMLLGSDDGIRVWLNDRLIHTNPSYRSAVPDQDSIPVTLKEGLNKILVKVLQGGGGWGFFLRFVDPDGILEWSTENK